LRLETELEVALQVAEAEKNLSAAAIAAIGDDISIQRYYAIYDGGEEVLRSPVASVFADGRIHKQEKALSPALDRNMTHVEITAPPLDVEGNVIAGIKVVRDISAHKEPKRPSDLAPPSRFFRRTPRRGGAGGRLLLTTICEASEKMVVSIDAMLARCRLTCTELRCEPVDLSAIAEELTAQLSLHQSSRAAEVVVTTGLRAYGDRRLLEAVLGDLLIDAWKYSRGVAAPRIEVGRGSKGGDGFFRPRQR